MSGFTGSCHCGMVRFRVDAAITELTTCDCSLCVKRNALMTKVPEQALDGVDMASLPVRATEGASMTIEDPTPNPD